MTREIDRCRWALDTARAGRDVALVCSGDAGVYGMASPLLELAEEYPDVNVEVVPGLTAALSGGAVLAPRWPTISASSRCRTASRRGRSSKSGWPAPLRAISRWRCTIPRPRAARTICAGLWTSCWRTAKPRTPSAVLCGTLVGKGRKSTSCPQPAPGYRGGYVHHRLCGQRRHPRAERADGHAAGVPPMNVVVFSGTTEGRELSRQLAALGIEVTVSVATPLGQEEQGRTPGVTVRCGRLLPDEMAALLGDAALCIDATHPYAVEATKTSKQQQRRPGWNTSACCARPVRCRKLSRL